MFSLWSNGKSTAQPAPQEALKPAATPPPPALPAPSPPDTALEPQSSMFTTRSMKQLGLFFAGAGFFAASAIIARRAVARKQLAAVPKFYQQSHRSATTAGNEASPLLAIEALNLATLNTVSFFMMITGGAAWALDISSLDDIRRMARRNIGPPGAQTDEALEREIEEWAARVFRRKKAQASDETTQEKR